MLAALALDMFLNMGLTGRAAWVPDLLAVVLVFWTVHQPQRVGIGAAFVFGLLLDVHQGALLGQNALAYTVRSVLAVSIQRRAGHWQRELTRLVWRRYPAFGLDDYVVVHVVIACILAADSAAG